jgi:hypothetical protein
MRHAARLTASMLVLAIAALLGSVQLTHATSTASDVGQQISDDISSAASAVGAAISHSAHAVGDTAGHVRDAMLHGTAEAVSAVMRRLHAQGSSNGNGNGNAKGNGNKDLRKNPWSVRWLHMHAR